MRYLHIAFVLSLCIVTVPAESQTSSASTTGQSTAGVSPSLATPPLRQAWYSCVR